ncbi:MAG TPA: hypothetical protein VGE13_03105 [Candidatus Saccharimonadales bacterium]
MTSNIEKIIAIAPTFIGATIDVQWQNACGSSMRYVEKATVDGFTVRWLEGEQPSITFYATDFRRELHFLYGQKIEQLSVKDTDTEFTFLIDKIAGVWNIGTTTQMRILGMEDEQSLFGPMRVVLTKR